ncbi:hypothetical protein [Antrihabitans spumae]|uniref:Uncharacterized protein n=1 Tax=Antrihabitans spumae TaxID=3373370 RepID=A0ABW7K6D2_9NOCA
MSLFDAAGGKSVAMSKNHRPDTDNLEDNTESMAGTCGKARSTPLRLSFSRSRTTVNGATA